MAMFKKSFIINNSLSEIGNILVCEFAGKSRGQRHFLSMHRVLKNIKLWSVNYVLFKMQIYANIFLMFLQSLSLICYRKWSKLLAEAMGDDSILLGNSVFIS